MNFVAKLEQIKGDIQDVVSIMTMHETEVQALKSNKTLVSDEARYPIKLDEADKLTHNSNITADCLSLWLQTTKVTTNHYLNKRQVKPYGIAEYNGLLAIPIRIMLLEQNACSLDNSGDISYLSDTGPNGGYYVMGKATANPIIIGVDLIDIVSAYTATGYMSVASITKENLTSVIVDIHTRYPAHKIVLLSDSLIDIARGEAELLEAIVSAKAYIAVLPESSSNCRTYNDVLCVEGPDAIAKLIEDAEEFDVDAGAEGSKQANLITNIIDIFHAAGTERMFSRQLVEQLNLLDTDSSSMLCQGQVLTQRLLANLLKPYQIKTKKLRQGSITGRGFYLEQFLK